MKSEEKSGVVIKRTSFDAFGEKPPETQKDDPRRRIAEIDGAQFWGFDLEEIEECIDTISNPSNRIIFVTGAAGTGKSSLVRYIQYYFAHLATVEEKRNVVVVAPTAVAAIAAGAVTIHSFFGFPHKPPDSFIKDIKPTNQKNLFRELDILIIDEISMVRADLLDAIEKALRKNRGTQKLFGGVQIVMVGDLLQLPPIVATPKEKMAFAPAPDARYPSRYFLGARCMQKRTMVTIFLKTARRQIDEEFVRILSDIRMETNIGSALKILNHKCLRPISTDIRPIAIVPTNRDAERINLHELGKIESPEKVYKATISGKFDPNSRKPAPDPLKLKTGAQVMLVKNHPGGQWINGTLGKVVEMREDSVRVRSLDGKQSFNVGRAAWETLRITYDTKRQRIVSEVIGEYRQFPITLGWAATIHKVQGATLQCVLVDMKGGAFAQGQTYVALSRCKSMSDLYLGRDLRPGDVMADPDVVQWYRKWYEEEEM